MNHAIATAEPQRPSWTSGSDRLTPRDFQQLAAFIQNYSGIKMPLSKLTMVEGRLRKRVRALNLPTLSAYCDYLFKKDGLDIEGIYLIDAITTNKTEFFREPEHFRILADELLPAIAAQRRPSNRAPIKIWSAAASIGAEAYTIAMVLAEFERQHPATASTVFATDISTDVLKTAKQGIYPSAMLTPVPSALRNRYTMQSSDRSLELSRIVPELRARVMFGRLNLMDHNYALDRDMDVVFCRNILIYFEKATQSDVLRRLCDHLRPGGYLILGHSETLSGFDLPVSSIGTTIFRRE